MLITGANSGIGLEFAKQYAAAGWEVIATHRRRLAPDSLTKLARQYDNVSVETIDVTDPESIAATAAKLAGTPIDVLVNNAGIVGTFEDPRQKFGSLDYDLAQQFVAVNSTGPLRVSEAFYENVVASQQKKIVAISSLAGSLAVNSRKGLMPKGMTTRYWYNMSKAALNLTFTALAKDVAADGVSVGIYHPGLVRVERNASYRTTDEMKAVSVDVDVSVAALRQLIQELTPEVSGRFFSYTGTEVPW
ncbi:MAG: SDR family NAD(P)-dependent oxidoreductase [Gammaproteobacteria bacterium]|nr:SDR family NAD(P)-dependent oxidoreductase [Gammaproteobacteria bacterium]